MSERKLKHLQRVVSRKKRGSNRRKKAVLQLAGLHEHVVNQRKTYAHKISRQLVNRYGLIAFEQLHVQGMIKNHYLAKSIADAGWSQLIQYVTYTAESACRRVVLVDPRNTSQQCSSFDEIVQKSLAERINACTCCGYTADRDVNATQNILKRSLVS